MSGFEKAVPERLPLSKRSGRTRKFLPVASVRPPLANRKPLAEINYRVDSGLGMGAR